MRLRPPRGRRTPRTSPARSPVLQRRDVRHRVLHAESLSASGSATPRSVAPGNAPRVSSGGARGSESTGLLTTVRWTSSPEPKMRFSEGSGVLMTQSHQEYDPKMLEYGRSTHIQPQSHPNRIMLTCNLHRVQSLDPAPKY